MKRKHFLALVAVLAIFLAACGRGPATDYEDVSGDTWMEYTVLPSQTWRSIAEDFFGAGDNAARIAADNGGELSTPPREGQKLKIRIRHDELDLVRRLASAREPYNAGVAYHEAQDYENAVKAFREALRRAPEFVDARYNLGLALLKLGQPTEAAKELQPVVLAREGDKDAHYGLASAYFHLGAYPQAAQELREALRLDENFLRARFTLALALERMGDSEGARKAWQSYLKLDSSSAWAKEARSHLETLP